VIEKKLWDSPPFDAKKKSKKSRSKGKKDKKEIAD